MMMSLQCVSLFSTEIRRRGLSQKTATAANTTGLTSPVTANASPLSGDYVAPSEGETSFSRLLVKILANVAVLVIVLILENVTLQRREKALSFGLKFHSSFYISAR